MQSPTPAEYERSESNTMDTLPSDLRIAVYLFRTTLQIRFQERESNEFSYLAIIHVNVYPLWFGQTVDVKVSYFSLIRKDS